MTAHDEARRESPLDTKYLRFEELARSKSGKTRRIRVLSRRRNLLGDIGWYASWRQYVFAPQPNTVFSTDCLNDIQGSLAHLNTMHRDALAAEEDV